MGSGKNLVQVRRSYVALKHGGMGTVRGIQRESIRVDSPKPCVRGGRSCNHRCIRLQQDVDGGDIVLVRVGGNGLGCGAADAEGQQSCESKALCTVEQDVLNVGVHGHCF